MGWNRRPPEQVEAPEPLWPIAWLGTAVLALLAAVGLFFLAVSERVPELKALNPWLLSGSPLLLWLLVFGARAYVYGNALSHHQFLEEQAGEAQRAWSQWAQRYMAVKTSHVLLPDQVTASVFVAGGNGRPRRSGVARRITALPMQPLERVTTALELLLAPLAAALAALPGDQPLRVTLLNDMGPAQQATLRQTWERLWSSPSAKMPPASLVLADELSYGVLDEQLKAGEVALDLILVLQVNGESVYSDGLAALLLCSDASEHARQGPVQARLLRPMPLEIDKLEGEVSLFLQTQDLALKATGVLADGVGWQPGMGKLISVGGASGAALDAEQQWMQEALCGHPGPFSSWLLAALGVEMVRLQQAPLVALAQERSQRWISTVATGELV